MKQALLCVSFGTANETGWKDLAAVENALRAVQPACHFARAFTSSTLCRRLAAQGQAIDELGQALARLEKDGYRDVAVQSTHLLYGDGYDTMKAEIAPWQKQFVHLTLGEPLLAGYQDLQQVARVLGEHYPAKAGEALLLMGHGTRHFAGVVYPALQSAFALQGRPDVLVAAAIGGPALEEVLPQLRAAGAKTVHLVPLLLVAGAHTFHDLAGTAPQSWKSRLEAEGFSVCCTLEGLGRLPGIQKIYQAKCRKLLRQTGPLEE